MPTMRWPVNSLLGIIGKVAAFHSQITKATTIKMPITKGQSTVALRQGLVFPPAETPTKLPTSQYDADETFAHQRGNTYNNVRPPTERKPPTKSILGNISRTVVCCAR